jgi:hypothetical protein
MSHLRIACLCLTFTILFQRLVHYYSIQSHSSFQPHQKLSELSPVRYCFFLETEQLLTFKPDGGTSRVRKADRSTCLSDYTAFVLSTILIISVFYSDLSVANPLKRAKNIH